MKFHRDEGGQAIFVIATTMLGMLFMVGLAMDAGQLYNGRRTAQEAADSAAFAGAVVLYQQGTTAQATSAATNDASINGYSTNAPTSGTTVTAQVVTFSGNTSCVQVDISTPVRTSLVPQQSAFTNVQAHATACSQARTSGYAVMATDQTCSTADLRLQSSGTMVVHGGSIQVNSCGTPAASVSGTISVDATYEMDVVGTIDPWPCPGCPAGATYTSKPVQPDPFAGSPKPPLGPSQPTPVCAPTINQPGTYTADAQGSACQYLFAPGTYIWKGVAPQFTGGAYGCTGNLVNTTSTTAVAPGTVVVTPASMTNIGVEKALIVGSGASEEVVTPSAVTGTTFTAKFGKSHSGTWDIKGGCTTATGDGGVFFFVTNANYPASGGVCHDVKIAGSASAVLSPPDSGTYKGMLLWVDSTCTTGVILDGTGTFYTSGAIYVPNGTLEANGNGATVYSSQIIAEKVDAQNGNITMNYDSGNAYAGKIPALVN